MAVDISSLQKAWPGIESCLKEFFSDKYNENEIMSISNDLKDLFREQFISEIQFILYDINEKKVICGFNLIIDYHAPRSYECRSSFSMKTDIVSGSCEKYLFVKLTDEFFKAAIKDELINETLENSWAYSRGCSCPFEGSDDFISEINSFSIRKGEYRGA